MADVTHSEICSSLEPATATCRLTGAACPFAKGGFAACPDSTFITRVSMPPDEFCVLLNAEGRPALGTIAVKKCRRPEFHFGSAGVHVNAVLESVGDGALLQATWRMDGGVEYCCPGPDVRMVWRGGKFIPV
jgi:hypothetical protein